MVLDTDLEIDLEGIDWENMGDYVEATPEGFTIRDNKTGTELIVIKRIEPGQNADELENESRKVVREYCIKLYGRELIYFSEVYEREILVGPYISRSSRINGLIIGRAYYNNSLIEWFRAHERLLKRAFPMGYNVYKKLIRGDEGGIRALRKYTRKVLGDRGFRYRPVGTGNVELYHQELKDLPEEVFKNTLAKISRGGVVNIPDIQFLPYKVKKGVFEERGKKKRIVETKTTEYEERPSDDELCLPFDSYEIINECSYIEEVMRNSLTRKELDALLLIYKGDLGLTGAANHLGITKQAIAETEKRALHKLRHALNLENP